SLPEREGGHVPLTRLSSSQGGYERAYSYSIRPQSQSIGPAPAVCPERTSCQSATGLRMPGKPHPIIGKSSHRFQWGELRRRRGGGGGGRTEPHRGSGQIHPGRLR